MIIPQPIQHSSPHGKNHHLAQLLPVVMFAWLLATTPCLAAKRQPAAPAPPPAAPDFAGLRLAITDLIETFGNDYRDGPQFLVRLDQLQSSGARHPAVRREFAKLQQDALLANPLLDFDRLILLQRKRGQLGLPTNHQCNPSLKQTGYDNEIAILSPVRADGKRETLLRPPDGAFVGEIDLHFDADRLLFTMPAGKSWEVHEIHVDGSGMRQVSRRQADVDNFDACYLPSGRIVFASTASFTAVPCWHGRERACSLYVMNADGTGVRQLCFDQDLDLHPSVLPTGQVIFSRWDYTGIMHIYLRPLMVMNPDGTSQRAVYGSNSYYPNSLYFPRGIPGSPNQIAAILSGYHGVHRMGELVTLDTTRGWYQAEGIVRRIGHRDEPAEPVVRDALVDSSWPKFLHPYPLSEKYFITAAQLDGRAGWGIYLVDAFDNIVPLQVDPAYDFFEPIPVKRLPKPPVIPERIDLTRDDATVYVHDIYAGPGLADVPHGTVKRLRILSYHFGYPGMAGPDKIGRAGPWDAMRILGTVPVNDDGSVAFRVPACTPISLQPLDAQGKAVQLMRSWYTAMPGEVATCVGCHEQPRETPITRFEMAAITRPCEIEPWYGPPRGFDFEREVQPVLDQYCVGCHNGQPQPAGDKIADLRGERFFPDYRGLPLSKLGADRLDADIRDEFPACPPGPMIGDRRVRYTPAYEALYPYIRRVNIEDYVGLHVPGEYHADTSELIQMLRKGHHGVQLDDEAWDRLVTWIDLNGPCHGTWNDVCQVPHGADRRRRELSLQYGGPKADPEMIPVVTREPVEPIVPEPLRAVESPPIVVAGWPFDAAEARRRQSAGGHFEQTIDLGDAVAINLLRIPAGDFVMGDANGEADEYPVTHGAVERAFWMGRCEITNEQFQQFDPSHDSGLFMKRSLDRNGPGIAMNGPQQPAVRVSWKQATAFCAWLSQRTGRKVSLPTEAQWEYACRAGSSTPLCYGGCEDNFATVANVADAAIDRLYTVTGGVIVLQDIPAETRFDDKAIATADVGRYQPNAWGLHDMHGNAAEWTRSTYQPYPYRDDDGRNTPAAEGRKVVRGGSYYDRPHRCRSAFRLDYPAWQRVHNVGFRVVMEEDAERKDVTQASSHAAAQRCAARSHIYSLR